MPGFILRPMVALQLSVTARRRPVAARGAGMLEYALLAAMAIALLVILRAPLTAVFNSLVTRIQANTG